MSASFGPTIGSLFGIPPVESPVSALARALLEANRKPRSRSEWEARFSFWQRPASETEETKLAAAASRVRRAMLHSRDLAQRSWTIVEQGSYHNNTNTRTESDMDLCVCLTDAFFVDGPRGDFPTMAELGREPVPFTFDQYRAHIAWCLQQEFGVTAVTMGSTAIHLHKYDAERINADIVPAYVFQRFGARLSPFGARAAPDLGVALLTSAGKRQTNFPVQHHRSGCAKNDRTGHRYKRVVRILKRLRNHMADNADLPPAQREKMRATASFLIESLVYNCPDPVFGHPGIYDDVVALLRHLSNGLQDQTPITLLGMPAWARWTEVNGIKGLFASEQAWDRQGAANFVGAAQAYMGV
jgi:hypothetical protein